MPEDTNPDAMGSGITPQPPILEQVEGGDSVQSIALPQYAIVAEESRYGVSARTRYGIIMQSGHFFPQGYKAFGSLDDDGLTATTGFDAAHGPGTGAARQLDRMHWPSRMYGDSGGWFGSTAGSGFDSRHHYLGVVSEIFRNYHAEDIRRQRMSGKNLRLNEYAMIMPEFSVPLYIQLLGTVIGIVNMIRQSLRVGALNRLTQYMTDPWDQADLVERSGVLIDRLKRFNFPAIYGSAIMANYGVELYPDSMVWIKGTDFAYPYGYKLSANVANPDTSKFAMDPMAYVASILGGRKVTSLMSMFETPDTPARSENGNNDIWGRSNGVPAWTNSDRSPMTPARWDNLITECHLVLNTLSGDPQSRVQPPAYTMSAFEWDCYRIKDSMAALGFAEAVSFLSDNPKPGGFYLSLVNDFPHEAYVKDDGLILSHDEIRAPYPFSPLRSTNNALQDDATDFRNAANVWEDKREIPLFHSTDLVGNEALLLQLLRGNMGMYFYGSCVRGTTPEKGLSLGNFADFHPTSKPIISDYGKIDLQNSRIDACDAPYLLAIDLGMEERPIIFANAFKAGGTHFADHPSMSNPWTSGLIASAQSSIVDLAWFDSNSPADSIYVGKLVHAESRVKLAQKEFSKVLAVDMSHVYQYPRANIVGSYQPRDRRR